MITKYFPTAVLFDWENTIVETQTTIQDSQILKKIILKNGIIDLLQYLKKHNIFIAIVSNKDIHVLHNEVQFLHLNKYFDEIVGANSILFLKPSAEPIFFALKNTNFNKKKIFFVGDSISDMESAERAQINFILFNEKSNNLINENSKKHYISVKSHLSIIAYFNNFTK